MSHHSTDEPVCGIATFIPAPCLLLTSTGAFWTIQPAQLSAGSPQAHKNHVLAHIQNSLLLNKYNFHECTCNRSWPTCIRNWGLYKPDIILALKQQTWMFTQRKQVLTHWNDMRAVTNTHLSNTHTITDKMMHLFRGNQMIKLYFLIHTFFHQRIFEVWSTS